MPTRMVRSSLLHSERYENLSCDSARLLFIHLILNVDDLGNIEAGERPLMRRCQPLDVSGLEEFRALLAELVAAGLVALYEVEGKRYLHVFRLGARKRHVQTACPPSPWENNLEDYQRLAKKTTVGRQTTDGRATDDRRPAVAVAVAVAVADKDKNKTPPIPPLPDRPDGQAPTGAGSVADAPEGAEHGPNGKGRGKHKAPAKPRTKRNSDDDARTPMDLDGFIAYLTKGTGIHGEGVRRDHSLIAEFARDTRQCLTTRAQWLVFLRRNLRAASDLAVFEDRQIAAAWKRLQADVRSGRFQQFSLETVVRYATAARADAMPPQRATQYTPHRKG